MKTQLENAALTALHALEYTIRYRVRISDSRDILRLTSAIDELRDALDFPRRPLVPDPWLLTESGPMSGCGRLGLTADEVRAAIAKAEQLSLAPQHDHA